MVALSSRFIVSLTMRKKVLLRALVLPREGGLKPRLSHVHTAVMRAGDHYGWQPSKIMWLGLERGDFLKGKEGGC